MTRAPLLQSAAAYFLSAVVAWIFIAALILPIKNSWLGKKQRGNELALKLSQTQSEIAVTAKRQAHVRSRLFQSLENDTLVDQKTMQETAQILESSLKQAVENSSANMLQMRPSIESDSSWFSYAKMQASILVDSNNLGILMAGLANNRPILQLDLLSLRITSNNKLELSLNLTLPSMNEPTQQMVDSGQPTNTGTSQTTLLFPTQITAAELAGLFDRALRARWKSSTADSYRLSAISVSNTSRVAIIIDQLSNSTRRLTEGDMLDKWTIKSISEDSIKLIFGQTETELTLSK